MGKNVLFALVIASILLLIITNLNIFFTSQKFFSSIETVKGQLVSAKSGLVNFPVPDYSLAIALSVSSFAAGFAAALFFRKTD